MAPHSPNHDLLRTVRRTLHAQAALKDSYIRVTQQGDTLHLKGSVTSRDQKRLAERLVGQLAGTNVVNALQVDLSRPPRFVERLYQDRLRGLGLSDVYSEVEGRTVCLAGQVASWREREEAERLALTLPGIHTVVNTVRLEPPATPPKE